MSFFQDAKDTLWGELIQATMRISKGPISDRRTQIAYRDGLLTAYAIMNDESETETRERLLGIEAAR